jgi:hypothetical protein
LDWPPIPPRHFELIYRALAPKVAISAAEFSANAGFKLSEVFARFNLYGGANSITLYSDRLSFDFSNLLRADFPVVFDLMRSVHDEFPAVFPSCEYEQVEATGMHHFDLLPPGEVNEYLARFGATERLQSFSAVTPEFVLEPCARFGVKAADESWKCRFGVDRSLALANGLFVDSQMTLRLGNAVPFVDKLIFAEKIGNAYFQALELEHDDAV